MESQTQSNSNEIPLLTFNSLYNLLREEKKIKTLQKLPELFYEALEKFLNDKKTEILKLKKESTDNEKLKKEMHIHSSSKKIASELIQIRLSKISNSAIKSEMYQDETFFNSETLEKEKYFYENIKKATKTMRGLI